MPENRNGQIVTFYSYKGGVGRTMALANVAFLAAKNGKKVLMMDWDLEAPGLHYYFRGFVDSVEAKSFRDSPGVLDILWGWRNTVKKAKTGASITRAAQSMSGTGRMFSDCVRNINLGEEGAGQLDYISAGSTMVHSPGLRSYEEALADFSWQDFFTDSAGGTMLRGLREWAKSNYDIVLIDSRTGLADVSGVCTIQLPDVVALCFILNRQNVEGVAKVASAIRFKRGDEVSVRAVPMRVAHLSTGIEADAIARAIHELNKVGHFPIDSLMEDMKVLPVRAETTVPYFETLAPIIATEIETDPLTLNYQRLGHNLLGIDLNLPKLNPEWISAVKRRLQPKHATSEYLETLRNSDPIRATAELDALLDSALQDATDGMDLDDDYVEALVNTAIEIRSIYDEGSGTVGSLDMAIELCRTLVAEGPGRWHFLLVRALQAYLDDTLYMIDHAEQLAIFEEIDFLLTSATTAEEVICRIENKRQIARHYLSSDDFDAAQLTLFELRNLLIEARLKVGLNEDQFDRFLLMTVEADQIAGDISERQLDYERAISWYEIALSKIDTADSGSKTEFGRFTSELHSRIARAYNLAGKPDLAASAALNAAKAGQSSPGIIYSFIEFAQIIIQGGNISQLIDFCQISLDIGERRTSNQFASYYGRLPWIALDFVRVSHLITSLFLQQDSESELRIIATLVEINGLMVVSNLRRRTIGIDGRMSEWITAVSEYGALLISHKLYEGLGANLLSTLDNVRMHVRRPVN